MRTPPFLTLLTALALSLSAAAQNDSYDFELLFGDEPAETHEKDNAEGQVTEPDGNGDGQAHAEAPTSEPEEPQTAATSKAPATEASEPATDTVSLEAAELAAETPPVFTAEPAPKRRAIDEIVVTATKREKSTRDVPVSIDAFEGEALAQRGADKLSEILKFSPGVVLNESTGPDNAALSIRGIASEARNSIYSRPTGLFWEDVNMVNPSVLGVSPDPDPFDMATVEVLKGPQGTLFGGTALSGAIRYVPNKPDAEALAAQITGGVAAVADSNKKHWQGMGMLNLPIYEDLALRISHAHRYRANYVDDLRAQLHDLGFTDLEQSRVALQFAPLDPLTLDLSWMGRESASFGTRSVNDPKRRSTTRSRFPDYQNSDLDVITAKGSWNFEPLRVEAIYGQLDKTGDWVIDISAALAQSEGSTAFSNYDLKVSQPSYELRAVSNGLSGGNWFTRDWEYLAGLFYMVSDQIFRLVTNEDPAGGGDPDSATTVNIQSEIDITAWEKAFFFDATRVLADAWELNIGGRFYDTRIDGVSQGTYEGILIETVPITGQQRERGFNPKLSLTWRPNDRFSVFAAAQRGFRFGGYNAVDAALSAALEIPFVYISDTLWNYELGARSDWLDGRLIADVTAFYIEWEDLQIQQLRHGAWAFMDNVGAARSQGVEGSVQMLLPKGLFLTVNGAAIDSRTTVPFEADTATTPPGQRLPSAPYATGSGILSWSGTHGPWTVSANYSLSYIGNTFSQIDHAGGPIPSFTTHGAAVTLNRPDLPFKPSLSLTAINLWDKTGVSYSFFGGFPADTVAVGIEPRTVTLNLGLSFE